MKKIFLPILVASILSLMFFPSCEKADIIDDTENDDTDDTSVHEDSSDYVWDANSVIPVLLNGSDITVKSGPATATGSTLNINGTGNFSLTGTLSDGQVIINTEEKGTIRIILNGANISNSSGSPLFIGKADKVILVLADGTENSLTDGKTYSSAALEEQGTNAALYSKSDLTLYGNGSLTVTGNYADGISGKDGLIIKSGTITVTAADEGIRGQDYLILDGGRITVNSAGNAVLEASGSGSNPVYCAALKCDHDILLNGSNIEIKSTGKGGKGISSDGNLIISAGSVTVSTTGAGSTYTNSSGVKDAYNATCVTADGDISILGGTLKLTATGAGGKGITADGSLIIGDETHSPEIEITTSGEKIILSGNGREVDANESKAVSIDGTIALNNGITTISSADDGLKSKTSITINNGTLFIIKSIEGIEGPELTVNNGTINLVCSDDGFNATKGSGGEFNDGSALNLKGGNIVINASGGDGLDSNGSMTMTGGTVVVHGPQSQPEVGMDVNGTAEVSGGLLVISGIYSNMTEGPATSSKQYSILVRSNSQLSSSTFFHVQDADGNNLVTFKPVRAYSSVIYSCPDLKSGATYYIYTGGSSTGVNGNGLYTGGTYTGGTQKKSFTLSGKLTTVNF